MKRIKSDKILLSDRMLDGYVYFKDDKIMDVTSADYPVEEEYDATGLYISAGFIDIHTHGGGGNPFEGSVDDIVEGCNFHLKHGTTSICPTISAAPMESMARSARNIAAAMKDDRVKGTILGAHMEGPYLSAKQAGAQSPDFITPPVEKDYLPLIEECGDAIARWSYAPENDEDERFVKTLRDYGIIPSAGHTDAIFDDMKRAMEYGCNLVTHLYSCTSTVTRDHGFRRLGVIETAFLRDELTVELIADGKHLPLDLMRMILKIKGVERTVLTSDCLSLTGTQETEGVMNGVEYVLEDGVCKLRDRTAFAGSIATAPVLLKTALEVGVSLTDAVNMMSRNPARLLGLRKGELTEGFDADVTVLSDDLTVKAVFVSGERVK